MRTRSPSLPRRAMTNAPALILVASAAILATALAFQYLGGLAPCTLCHYQRWPYVAAIVAASVALALPGGGAARRGLVWFCGAVFLAGAAVAAYHVGVEQGVFAGPSACSGAATEATTVEELRRQLLAAPIVRCDEVAWSLFGISMAGYNLIASVLLAGFAVLSAVSAMKGDRR